MNYNFNSDSDDTQNVTSSLKSSHDIPNVVTPPDKVDALFIHRLEDSYPLQNINEIPSDPNDEHETYSNDYQGHCEDDYDDYDDKNDSGPYSSIGSYNSYDMDGRYDDGYNDEYGLYAERVLDAI